MLATLERWAVALGMLTLVDGPVPEMRVHLGTAEILGRLALLDGDVSFSALHAAEGVGDYLGSNTNANEVEETSADFQFAEGARAAEAIAQAKPGTLLYPDTSATIVVSVRELSPEPRSP